MTTSSPPRRIESLLEALDAQTDFRDALVGDLAEEFAIRADRDGGASARRWYYREAVRVAPHLLGHCVRGFHRRDVVRLASVVGLSYVCTATIGMFIFLTVNVVMRGLGLPVFWSHPLPTIVTVALLLVGSIGPAVGGYIAAWLDPRAPMVSAMALGATWASMVLVRTAIVGTAATLPPFPTWYLYGALAIVIVGTSAGGALRVCASRSSSRRDTAVAADRPALP